MTKTAAALLAGLILFAAPRPANAIQQFMVFFSQGNRERLDPIQWRITPEADAVISEFAAGYKRYNSGSVIISLSAADQRVGTLEMSIERSRFRLISVRDALIEKGVPGDRIQMSACGYEYNFVDRPAGISEPMNRFVRLDIESAGTDPELPAKACKRI